MYTVGLPKAACASVARERHGRHQCRFGVHDAHPAPAPAAGGFDDHRVTDLPRHLHDFLRILRQRALGPRHTGDAGLDHGHLGAHLVAHEPDGVGARTDEDEARALDLLGEVRVFGQESVARMDRLGVGHFRRRDDRRNVEIASRRGGGPDADGFVGEAHILGLAVGFGVDHHRLDAELATGALDPQRDLAAIGDQNLAEELVRILGHDRRRRGAQRRQVRRSRPAAVRTRPVARSRRAPA